MRRRLTGRMLLRVADRLVPGSSHAPASSLCAAQARVEAACAGPVCRHSRGAVLPNAAALALALGPLFLTHSPDRAWQQRRARRRSARGATSCPGRGRPRCGRATCTEAGALPRRRRWCWRWTRFACAGSSRCTPGGWMQAQHTAVAVCPCPGRGLRGFMRCWRDYSTPSCQVCREQGLRAGLKAGSGKPLRRSAAPFPPRCTPAPPRRDWGGPVKPGVEPAGRARGVGRGGDRGGRAVGGVPGGRKPPARGVGQRVRGAADAGQERVGVVTWLPSQGLPALSLPPASEAPPAPETGPFELHFCRARARATVDEGRLLFPALSRRGGFLPRCGASRGRSGAPFANERS